MIFSGTRVLVTGGSGGIGVALARVLLSQGARVLLTGRNKGALERARVTLLDPEDPDTVAVFPANLGSAQDRDQLCAFARTWHGGIDILVNNAGVSEFGLLEDQSTATIEQALAVNVLAPIELSRKLLPHLLSRREAHIVNIGSVFGAIGYPGFSTYSATKFALRGFSEALRRELKGTSVQVHHYAPRATRTSFNVIAVEAMNEELRVTMDSPQQVAESICALLAAGRKEATLGWPEKLFVKINALLPGIVDGALGKQLPIVKKFASKTTVLP